MNVVLRRLRADEFPAFLYDIEIGEARRLYGSMGYRETAVTMAKDLG